jgi:hypothetical protein
MLLGDRCEGSGIENAPGSSDPKLEKTIGSSTDPNRSFNLRYPEQMLVKIGK